MHYIYAIATDGNRLTQTKETRAYLLTEGTTKHPYEHKHTRA